MKNKAASDLYESDENQFLREVRTCILASMDDLQDNYDGFPIRLKPFNAFHKKIVDEMRGVDKTLSIPEQSAAFMDWFRKNFN